MSNASIGNTRPVFVAYLFGVGFALRKAMLKKMLRLVFLAVNPKCNFIRGLFQIGNGDIVIAWSK